ncbi:WD40 repeat-like protein [Violaceomyces palustris]|uniref:WD40 repeat-like protein n=1 Tax=Violaceomyces palustris TaxID=1673888 RepID=A0ACD0P1K0_9BASI|nr:WD40 repeat-like protein [Violaceomyces palustris]
MQAAYQLMADEPSTPRHKRKVTADMDAQKEASTSSSPRGYPSNANSHPPSSSTSSVHTSGGSSATRHSSNMSGMQSPSTPTKKNLFTYSSPSRSRGASGRSGSGTPRVVDFFGSDSQAGSRPTSALGGAGPTGGLFGGMTKSVISGSESLDSPRHRAYSLSPVKPESQRILLSPKKPPRTLSKVPFKVLDAPELADDFYLNLVDWSSKNVLGVGLGKCVYLWSAETSSVTQLCDLDKTEDSVTGINWSGKGNHIAVGTNKGLVQIWDAEKQKLVRTMTGHTQRVGSLAWNDYILTSGSRDRSIFHRDVRVPEHHIKELKGHRQEVCGLKWNVDNNQLASGGNDNRLLVWDGLMETPLHRFTEHTAAVKAIAWSPHQQGILASGGGTVDKKIRFWNTTTGTLLNEVDTGSQVCNLVWSKTSNELVSTHGYSGGAVQNQIQVWKYPSMQQIATLTGHTMRVLYLSMSPNGATIVTGAGDETLRFWDLNTPNKLQLDKRKESTALSPFSKLR